MVTVNWLDFSGDTPDYFNPYGLTYPVAPPETWASGGSADWPQGSGPGTGRLFVVGSDDLSGYDPSTDRLIFAFRDGDQVVEMNAHNYAVLWEEQANGLLTLNIMPVSIYESTSPIATIRNIQPSDLPTLAQSWATTNNHFQDDLVASLYSLDPNGGWPDNHIAIQTHIAGKVTTYDFDALQSEHGNDLVLNFVVMTGRELHMVYDQASQQMTISHYGESWGGYNDVWGKTVITGVTPQELADLPQLWRYDSTFEDHRLLNERFNDGLDSLVADGGVAPLEDLPELAVGNRRVEEGEDTVIRFNITLSEPSDQPVSVSYRTQASFADPGEDYVAKQGTVTFAPGETSAFVEVEVINDLIEEAEERLIFKLFDAEGADIADDRASGWIDDDDAYDASLPDLNVNNRRAEEGEGAFVRFRIDLSEAADQDVTLFYATRDSTAKAGSDYEALSGQLTIPAGDTAAFVEVDLVNDGAAEADERFFFEILDADGANVADGKAVGWIEDEDTAGLPGVQISEPRAREGDPTGGSGGGSTLIAAGPLSTSGNQILDSNGDAVEIRSVNWFGLETDIETPHGLWARNWQEMLEQIRDTGFNTIRLPFSAQVILDGGTPSGIDFGLNPDLQGLSGLEIMDKVIDYAGDLGLKILLDHHRSEVGNSANANGLWYDGRYNEDDWIEVWTTLAERYADQDNIIGADIHNEPHGQATWGDGSATDWAAAAERAGNAIHQVNADWLIVVEGIGSYQGDNYWWGGNLQGVADRPLVLDQADKLVYSPHDYPASVYAQPWFFDGSDLEQVFDEHWGFIYREEIAPILVGEFGSKLETDLDRDWAEAIVSYLDGDFDNDGQSDIAPGQSGMSWSWWSWNPNSGDTGGILEDDWTSIRQNAVTLLEPLLEGDGSASGGGTSLTFEVTLDHPYGEDLSLQYRTEDRSAEAGKDYEATSGALLFRAGETSKSVSVSVLPDQLDETVEFFRLYVTAPDGETYSAPGRILDDDGSAQPPPPPPGDADDFALDFTLDNDWGSGAQWTASLTNLSGEDSDAWALEFDLPFEIEQIWNAEVADQDGERYRVDEAAWNGAVEAGATVDFGFVASTGGISEQVLANQAEAEAFFT
ncbi:MAG: cellulase family glycosylhydrolase [Kiloniellales bacterium]